MKVTTVAGLVLMLVAVLPSANAADYEEYASLQTRAIELFDAVQADNVSDETREEAITAFLAVIEWLDTFFAEPDFTGLTPDQQAAAYSDRYRWEYNLSRQLLALDQCEEARDRTRILLDSSVTDPELRPHLAEAFEESVACLTRPRIATLHIDATPADAMVMVDGAFVGLAHSPLEVDLGPHTIVLRADSFDDATLEIEAESEGQIISLGPITLVATTQPTEPEVRAEPETARKLPTWYEWTLWGVGAAGIATGIILIVDAANLQNTLDSPPNGMIVDDPDREQDEIDSQRTIGYIAGGVGLACAITGTVLYLVRDVDDEPDDRAVSWGVDSSLHGARVWLGVAF